MTQHDRAKFQPSGKIQRRACRDLILAGSADVVGEWRLSVLRAA